MEQNLNFSEYLKKYYPEYQIDGHNRPTVEIVGSWALRASNFNNQDKARHIDKGICLFGNTGTGKTRLFWLLNKYLNYLKSQYCFAGRIVWEYASEFEKEGYLCFAELKNTLRNIYFDELALTDEADNPVREMIGHYANKALIGREIIMQMYNKFIETGYQSHFSTNKNPNDLRRIYGDVAFSRLYEMCNFIPMVGIDRRQSEVWKPAFKKNLNQPVAPKPESADYDGDGGNKKMLEQHYLDFLEGKPPATNIALLYLMLSAYGVKVATDEELREIMEGFEKTYKSEAPLTRATASEKEKIKQDYIWSQAQKAAVGIFFTRLKTAGSKSIFGERNVDDSILPGLPKK